MAAVAAFRNNELLVMRTNGISRHLHSREHAMIYLAIGLIVVWSAGLLFFAGRALNFSRLVLNNLAPGKSYWKSANFVRFGFFGFRLSFFGIAVDPASLTELGRQHQRRAIRNEWIAFAWGIGGFIFLIWASRYFMAS
jgi:heme/copper-type cytochrome/quinol oxidase subunit 3